MYIQSNKGHIFDTKKNRALLEAVANDTQAFIGTDIFNNQWYKKILQNNSEIWVRVYQHGIKNGGINEKPRIWTNPNNLNYKNIYPKKDEWFLTGLAVYDALLHFLKNYYKKTNSSYIGECLSDMIFLYDNESADPRAFDLWMEFIRENNAFTHDSAYLSMIQLIEIFYFKKETDDCKTFWKYITPINGTIPSQAQGNWDKAIDFVLTHEDSREYIQWQK